MVTTRDASLPPPFREALDALSLGPLWTALHVLLPNERVTAAVPHRWRWQNLHPLLLEAARLVPIEQAERRVLVRSEEHTSELQSPCNLVCRLLLEKKKKNK